MNAIAGQMSPFIRARSSARSTYSPFTLANDAISGSSWENAFTTRMPEKFSWAFVDRSPNFACSCSKRRLTRRPMNQKLIDVVGIRRSDRIVSFTLTFSIDATVKTSTSEVEVSMRIPKPII